MLEKEKETADKIAARAFAQQYLTDLLPSVYSNLKESGYFYDSVKRGKLTGMWTYTVEDKLLILQVEWMLIDLLQI